MNGHFCFEDKGLMARERAIDLTPFNKKNNQIRPWRFAYQIAKECNGPGRTRETDGREQKNDRGSGDGKAGLGALSL